MTSNNSKNRKMNVLTIEDDPVITEFLCTGLRYEGYRVTSVLTGKAGLEALERSPVDLVILDIIDVSWIH